MSEVARLFADMTGQLEDLHGLAVEGQSPEQPVEVISALSSAIASGIEALARTLLFIRLETDDHG